MDFSSGDQLRSQYQFTSRLLRVLYLEANIPNPLCANFILDTLLKGINRDKTIQVKQSLGITPELLLKIRCLLDLSAQYWARFWIAFVIAFFACLRKSYLTKNIDNHHYTKIGQVVSNQFHKNYSAQQKMCLYSTGGDP